MSRFAELCSVAFEHGYHLNFDAIPYAALDNTRRGLLAQRFDVNRIFSIRPTAESLKTLAGYRMLYKTSGSGFLLAVEVNTSVPGSQALVPVDDDLRLSFAITLKDKQFFNYSALPTQSGGVFRFSNQSGNTVSGNFLSRPVSDFDSGRSYEAGEIYFHPTAPNAGLFQALRDTGPAPTPVAADWERIPADTYDSGLNYPIGAVVLADDVIYRALISNPGTDLSDAAEWQVVSQLPNQHVTGDDYLPVHADQVSIDISAAAISEATVRIYRIDSSTVVHQQQFFADSADLDDLTIQLNHLRPGTYHLEVENSSNTVLADFNYDFYLSERALSEGWFGVIEIGIGAGSFALVDGTGQLANPQYNINFLNRSSRWRYIFPQPQTLGSGAQVVQEDSSGQVLVTNTPRPLTRSGSGIPLQADSLATPSVSEEVLLPQPNVNRIRYQASQWYSEVHMSNLPM
jgi:hypothetical protein